MKILFLDIDEVLTSIEFSERLLATTGKHRELDEVDPLACARLERVLQATGAKIVLSSTWRILRSTAFVQDVLRNAGAPSAEIISVTPRLDAGPCPELAIWLAKTRGEEISVWLATAAHRVGRYAIVDDGEDAGEGHDPSVFVCTTVEQGLTDADADRLIQILNASPDAETNDQ